ncbi:MAG: agmatinase, partial [Chloroflexi bacterium]|nr:agmatinase [Chloroflexota bacterium]
MESPRFVGVRTFMRLPAVRTTADVDFAIVGIPFDTGSSFRIGQRFAPEAIRSASVMLRPYVAELDVDIFEHCSGVDYGDAPVVPGYIEDSYSRIESFLQPLLDAGVVPLAMGGDHSITLPELRAVARRYGPVALVHFDAHTDTWDEFYGHKYHHGTPFRRAVEEGLLVPERSIQLGMRGSYFSADDLETSRRLGFQVVTMPELRRLGTPAAVELIRRRVDGHPAFLSFDVDFVDPAFAPGTGTPEVAGATSPEAIDLVTGLTDIPFVGFDLVEVLPAYDPAQITAFLAANLLHRCLALHTRCRKRGSGVGG